MAPVHVTSEIGPLRAVLVHTPGRELVAVTPGNREDYLYDDIIDLDLAQQEHAQLVAVLQRFAEVYEVRDLLTELVARPDVREFLVTRALEVVPSDALARRLAQLAPRELVSLMVEGALEEAGPIARALNEVGYALPPLPNLFFTRDVGRAHGPPPRHDRATARPGAVLRLPAAFRGAGAAGGLAPSQEGEGCEGGPEFLCGDAGRGSAARADLLRGQQPRAAGARAVGERLQLLRRATGSGDRLRAKRGHGVRARARRVQGRERGAVALGRRRREGGGAGRDR